jgi:membrane carboxypeptidase/penicillin-binding protein
MVGGRDYNESQFNRAAEALRQPGSTFKPFVYAAALERGMTPVTVYNDAPMEFQFYNRKNYKPANYGDSYAMKNITLKTALAKSSNVVAVKTAVDAGLETVARKAGDFGFDNIQAYPSMALGTMEVTPLQLAAAYAAFVNGGRRVEPTFIDRIVSVDDEIVYRSEQPDEQIISPRTAYMITDMLRAVVERGTASKAAGALGKDVAFAGKTGSSKDGWFVGYTPNLITVAWVGLDENEDIQATGGEVALPLWTDFMKSVVQARPEFGGENFAMPRGLTEVTVDPETGMLADAFCPAKEKVVVATGVVSGIRCFKHQPMPESFVADADAPQANQPPMESEAAAVVIETETSGTNEDPVLKNSDNAPPVKREKTEKSLPTQEIRKTYFEDFENHKSGKGIEH